MRALNIEWAQRKNLGKGEQVSLEVYTYLANKSDSAYKVV